MGKMSGTLESSLMIGVYQQVPGLPVVECGPSRRGPQRPNLVQPGEAGAWLTWPTLWSLVRPGCHPSGCRAAAPPAAVAAMERTERAPAAPYAAHAFAPAQKNYVLSDMSSTIVPVFEAGLESFGSLKLGQIKAQNGQ